MDSGHLGYRNFVSDYMTSLIHVPLVISSGQMHTLPMAYIQAMFPFSILSIHFTDCLLNLGQKLIMIV